MKTNYTTPLIEVIEIEIENSILAASGTPGTFDVPNFPNDGNAWN